MHRSRLLFGYGLLVAVLGGSLLSGAALVVAQESRPAPESRPTQEPAKPTSQPATPSGPQSTPEGKALIAKVIEATGGIEKLNALKNMTWKGSETRVTPQGVSERDINGLVTFPRALFRMDMTTQGQKFTFCITDRAGWQKSIRGVQDLNESVQKEFRASLRLSTTPLLRHHAELIVQELDRDVLAGREFRVLRAWRGEQGPVDFYIDPNTFLIHRKKLKVISQGTERVREEQLWDYRKVGDLTLPFSRTLFEDGKKTAIISIREYEFNRDLPKETFEKPAG